MSWTVLSADAVSISVPIINSIKAGKNAVRGMK